MSAYLVGDVVIDFRAAPPSGVFVRSPTPAPPPPPPPPPSSGAITIAVLAEFVDTAGVRQSVDPLSGGTITGVAPLLLSIDATGTRAPTAFAAYAGSAEIYTAAGHATDASPAAAAAEAYAHLACGYRINLGGGAGSGSWAYPEGAGQSKNEDGGTPLWRATMTEVGTHTVRIRVLDPLGNESTVSFPVTVQAPAAATHIPVAAGSWPTFVSGGHYTLQAGGDYRSFGNIITSDLHNVLIERTGAGADPRVAGWNPDNRSKFGETAFLPTRTRHVRLVGIDIDVLSEGQRGFDFCAAINCRTRLYNSGGQDFLFNEGANNERSACRFVRGMFFVGGELSNIGSGNGFTLFGTWHTLVIMGCLVNATDSGPTTWLVLRVYGSKHSIRHSKIRINHAETSACGTPLSLLAGSGGADTAWPSTDLPAAIGSAARYGLRNEHSHGYRIQFYDASSSRANAVFSTGGNPDGTDIVRPRLIGLEDCVWYQNATPIGILNESIELAGRGMYARNNRRNMGAGSLVVAEPENPNQGATGSPTTWHGPYGVDLPARPVPTAFA